MQENPFLNSLKDHFAEDFSNALKILKEEVFFNTITSSWLTTTGGDEMTYRGLHLDNFPVSLDDLTKLIIENKTQIWENIGRDFSKTQNDRILWEVLYYVSVRLYDHKKSAEMRSYICGLFKEEVERILRLERQENLSPRVLDQYDEGELLKAQKHFWRKKIEFLYKLLERWEEKLDIDKMCQHSVADIMIFVCELKYQRTIEIINRSEKTLKQILQDRSDWQDVTNPRSFSLENYLE